MTNEDRRKQIDGLIHQLAILGNHVVLAIDVDNVLDIMGVVEIGEGLTFHERLGVANRIAMEAAEHLAENELGVLPITEAVKNAAKELYGVQKEGDE